MTLTDGQEWLDGRVHKGRVCITVAHGGEGVSFSELAEEDRETYAKDAISDILTALYGPAGFYKTPHTPDGSTMIRVDNWPERASAAKLVTAALSSWHGDAEDYTVGESNESKAEALDALADNETTDEAEYHRLRAEAARLRAE